MTNIRRPVIPRPAVATFPARAKRSEPAPRPHPLVVLAKSLHAARTPEDKIREALVSKNARMSEPARLDAPAIEELVTGKKVEPAPAEPESEPAPAVQQIEPGGEPAKPPSGKGKRGGSK